jgi:hypothetical protein
MMKERKSPGNPETEEHHMDTEPGTMKKGKGQAALGRDIQAKIGQQLRSYYDTLLEPTPDRFAELLSQLENKRKEGSE